MKKALVFLFLVLMVFGMTGTARAVPVSVEWSVNGHEYIFMPVIDNFISWDSARDAAQKIGAGWDLATITSAEEMKFIINSVIISATTYSTFWVGGYQELGNDSYDGNAKDLRNSLGWRWVTDEAWTGALWSSGQPDDYLEDQKYLALYNSAAGWGLDDNTTYRPGFRGFIAENSAPVPEPATMLLLGSGLIGLAGFGRKKLFKKA